MEALPSPARFVMDRMFQRANKKGEAFLKTIGRRYTFTVDGLSVGYWLPESIKGDFDFVPFFEQAIRRNREVFGAVPSDLEFVIMDTTDHYNQYKKILLPTSAPKKKGDFEKGRRLPGNKVMVFHFDALESETNLKPRSGKGDINKKREYYQKLITHEVAHAAIGQTADEAQGWTLKGIKGKIPDWLHEGIAYLVAGQSNDLSNEKSIELRDKIKKEKKPPEDDDIYAYVFQFTHWFYFTYTTTNLPYTPLEDPDNGIYSLQRINMMVDVVRQIGLGVRFDKAFFKTFGIPYKEAFNQFIEYLNSIKN